MDNANTMEYRIGLEKQNKRNDQVTELILDNCRASQISGLTDEFVNLEMLSLINVGLTTLKGFPKLPKLRKLELSDNRLTGSLNLLHGSPKLQHLNLSGNRIKDLEALEPLKEFHELVSLDLYNCEITKIEEYRKKLFELLPNLKALDGYDKFDAEVVDSDEDEEDGSDVDNHIARNDLDEDQGPDEVEDGSDDEDEGDYLSSDDSQMDDEQQLDDLEGDFDEEGEEDDDLDDDDEDDDDDDDDDDEEEDLEQDSSGIISANATNNNDRTHENLDEEEEDQNEIQDLDGEEVGDEEEYDDEDEGSDLKLLQKDSIIDDEDDADFEPTTLEPDERDHEIDPEDDADEENEIVESGQLSASTLDTTKETESGGTRGQKRKFEEEGGDEGDEAEGENASGGGHD